MKLVYNYIFILTLSLKFLTGFSQNKVGCNTVMTKPPSRSRSSMDCQREFNKVYKFIISHHVVSLPNSGPVISRSTINAFNKELNRNFADADILFIDCGSNDEFPRDYGGVSLADYQAVYKPLLNKGTINIYWGSSCVHNNKAVGGLYDPETNIILMDGSFNPDIENDKRPSALTHEMGHYLGLWHTFGHGNEGTTDELVTRVADPNLPYLPNCGSAGDYICDTPSDPNRWNANCTYSSPAVDANGQKYTPDPTNFMSYSSQSQWSICVTNFTNCQNESMRNNAEYEQDVELTQHQQHISTELNNVTKTYTYPTIFATNTIIGNSIVKYDGMAYVVLKPGFKAVKGVNFNARIHFDCDNLSLPATKIKNTQTSIKQELQDVHNLIIFPNPSNSIVNINFSLIEKSNVRLFVKNIYGQEIMLVKDNEVYQAGNNAAMQVNISGLSAGVYFFVLKTEMATTTKKFIKID